jgi:hypothetical protein
MLERSIKNMCRVYYSYVVCHQNGIQKESGTASVDVNTSSESDAKAAAEGLAIKAKCYRSAGVDGIGGMSARGS